MSLQIHCSKHARELIAKRCRCCGEKFDPTPSQIKKNDFRCRPCSREYEREYRKRTNTAGPTIIPKPSHCKWCVEPAFMQTGKIWLCVKHIRFQRMKSLSSTRGLPSPSYEELELMVPENMICPCCNRKMNWSARKKRSTAITLQHDRNGEMRLICFGCNVKHGILPEDIFYEIKDNEKYCNGCKQIKKKTDFYKHKSKKTRIEYLSRCKKCCSEKSRLFLKNNKEWKRKYDREYRIRRKLEGRPLP